MLKQKQQEKDEVQIYKFWQMFKQLHINITLADALILMPKYQKMIKALMSNKEKLQELANTPLNENCSAFDIESDLKEIEFLFYQDKDSSLKDLIYQKGLTNLDDIFVDTIPEMFIDEQALDYSSPPIFDVYNDDFLEVKSDARNVYDDPFDSKGEKIKESKILIDELDLPYDFHPLFKYDSFIS
nr:reverse transcriptase domain-containing protein [Tanacetum cinerariifolium]